MNKARSIAPPEDNQQEIEVVDEDNNVIDAEEIKGK